MTKVEFVRITVYIGLAINKPLSPDALDVYFDLLGDLPADVFETAAKRVLLEHRWSTFPSIAELREAAVLTVRGEINALSAGEAWELAWRAVSNIDPEIPSSIEQSMGRLPRTVRDAISAMGLLAMCYGEEPVAVVRGQFMDIYAEIAARDARAALLPASTRAAIAAAPEKFLPQPVKALLQGIGGAPQT